MFQRRTSVQNKAVARQMTGFFDRLTPAERESPETAARNYGRYLWSTRRQTLVREKRLAGAPFHVGLATGDDGGIGFADLTRRTALVTDTLLLSHDWNGGYHELGVQREEGTRSRRRRHFDVFGVNPAFDLGHVADSVRETRELNARNNITTTFGMHCPDLGALGGWLLDAEPLLRSGLAWYLPSYSLGRYERVEGVRREIPDQRAEQVKAIDYLVQGGRAVDASGAEPVKSRLVRPVLRTELPFLQGVTLRDFAEITAAEFDSYRAFRDFLRLRLLDLDDSLNDVQSEQAIVKLGLEINDEIRAMSARLTKTRRKLAVTAAGASVATVGTILTAVYGPALAAAFTAVGATGGVWSFVNAIAENNVRDLRQDRWYYVWALARKSTTIG